MKNKLYFYFVVIIAILTLTNCADNRFDLQIFGNEKAVGADVYIDGKLSGRMEKFGDKGSQYGVWLKNGTYRIEIKKEGYHTYIETINVKKDEAERYLRVEMEKDSL
jgi:hypothetical protein